MGILKNIFQQHIGVAKLSMNVAEPNLCCQLLPPLLLPSLEGRWRESSVLVATATKAQTDIRRFPKEQREVKSISF